MSPTSEVMLPSRTPDQILDPRLSGPVNDPIHLHGHTFQVQGADDAPRARKDTVLVAPMITVTVDFDTDNPGQWITHCHNTYHLQAGMGTFITYRG